MNEAETYHHTQNGPWWWLLIATGVGLLAADWFMPLMALQIVFAAAGVLVLVMAAAFRRLTVADEGWQLAVRFGPLPLFCKRIFYEDIQEVKIGRSTFIDGWGVHWNPVRGWIWNISGFDCVELRLRKGRLRIGTDEPDRLAAFLRSRMTSPASPPRGPKSE